MDKDFIEKISRWCAKVGKGEAIRRLILAGISPSMATKIIYGTYRNQPKGLHEKAILAAMR